MPTTKRYARGTTAQRRDLAAYVRSLRKLRDNRNRETDGHTSHFGRGLSVGMASAFQIAARHAIRMFRFDR